MVSLQNLSPNGESQVQEKFHKVIFASKCYIMLVLFCTAVDQANKRLHCFLCHLVFAGVHETKAQCNMRFLMASSSNQRSSITHLLAPAIPAISGPRDETLPLILIEGKSEKFKPHHCSPPNNIQQNLMYLSSLIALHFTWRHKKTSITFIFQICFSLLDQISSFLQIHK